MYLASICCPHSGSLFHSPAHLIIPYDNMLLDLLSQLFIQSRMNCESCVLLPLFDYTNYRVKVSTKMDKFSTIPHASYFLRV